jgi:hypothetical protein
MDASGARIGKPNSWLSLKNMSQADCPCARSPGDRFDHRRPGATLTADNSPVADGDFGVRGFMVAFDENIGKKAWRFYTVPGPGDLGRDTWSGDSLGRAGFCGPRVNGLAVQIAA